MWLRKLPKRTTKRAVALAVAVVLAAGTILPHLQIAPYAASECPLGLSHEWTGLTMYWTNIETSNPGELMLWPRKIYLDGEGKGVYSGMDNHYCFCIANHVGQCARGGEAYIKDGGALLVQDYANFDGNKDMNYDRFLQDIMKKFTFCLAAAAALYPGTRTDEQLADSIEDTYMYAMSASLFIAIEGRTGYAIRTMDKEAAREAFHGAMDLEFSLEPNPYTSYLINPTIKAQLLANRDAFFDQVWDAALVMYNAIHTSGTTTIANILNGAQDPANPQNFIITVDCHQNQNLWTNYYSKMYATAPEGCHKIAESYDPATGIGTLTFQAPLGSDGTVSASLLEFEFENSAYLTDLSKPVLYQLNFCTVDDGVHVANCGQWQTMFCAMHETPKFRLTPNPPPPEGSDGNIKLEVHRYRHSENWQTTYNVDLLKFDSETGKPLEGSKWDVLEYDTLGQWDEGGTQLGDTYLDHPVSEAGSIGTKYNWANDDGSQFTRWEDEDACAMDVNITGEDGYLYDSNSVGNITNTKAHSDVYHYTYTKGYCTGHPKPEVTYYECMHDPEDDCDCEEKNAELDKIAEEAYKEQVEYCEKLAAEGGFFHTASESITDEAKKQLEADRDEFYKNFISLTYDYSAEEIGARTGYILHGGHTDDIPVERVVVHSSEYLNEIAGGGTPGSGVVGGEEEEIEGPGEDPDGGEGDGSEDAGHESRRSARQNRQTNAGNTIKSSIQADAQAADNTGGQEASTDTSGDAVGQEGQTAQKDGTPENQAGTAETTHVASKSTANESISGKLRTASKPNADKASLSPEDDPEQNMELDFELLDGTETASVSDAGRPERGSTFSILWGKAMSFSKPSSARFFGIRRAAGNDEGDEGGGGYARNDTEPPKHGAPVTYVGATNFEESDLEPHTQGQRDIECWTFTVYDHRTEGEIHFNKRDLDLNARSGDREADGDTNTLFNAYTQENADGTLEGAVYGLFASMDIIHPDSNQSGETGQDTGLVYQAGDLVAVAATDRNGDASFMVFTEAPGMTYDYETGAIVARTDKVWEGPSNLHTEEEKADDAVQDNEKFYGWDTEGLEEVTLKDSVSGDNTFYWKRSSNQGLNQGEGQDDGTRYPILNNEDNNGNCWIGRPLIVSGKDTASYYIKELSRSEGYELSVYGKDMTLTNREAPEDGSMVAEGSVSIGSMQTIYANRDGTSLTEGTLDITATDTAGGFDVTFKNMTKDGNKAEFFFVESKMVDKEVPVYKLVKKRYPVIAKAGTPVLIEGERVEAGLGDTIDLPNGTSAEVNNTITYSGDKFYIPKNQIALALPNAARFASAAGGNFMEKYNSALEVKKFGVPAANAPWLLVPKSGIDAQDFTAMTDTLNSYTGFNQMRIVADLGSAYAVQYSHSEDPESIYDLNGQILWVKKDATIDGAAGFLYAGYPAGELTSNGTGFILNNQQPDRNVFGKYEDLSTVAFNDASGGTFWAYAEGEQALEGDGSPAFIEKLEEEQDGTTIAKVNVDVLTSIETAYDAATDTYTLHFDGPGTYSLRIHYERDMEGAITAAEYARENAIISYTIGTKAAGTYMETVQLDYPGQGGATQDAGTIQKPTGIYERPIRQKVRIEKDIQTLQETRQVWYCLNCGYENQDGTAACGFCGRARSTEETKFIDYAHDTYAAAHADNISAERDGGWYETAKDWLGNLLKGNPPEEGPESIGNFRFKAYLKSNLERLYRDEEGHIVWMDRNGNTMTPQYEDTNGDGNYDTFTWKYDTAYDGRTVDFPEKDKVSGEGAGEGDGGTAGTIAENAVLLSSNVQKIYTDVEHRTESKTTSARANNVWDTYADPQDGVRENAGQVEGYTTSERENRPEGDAVTTNASLYSYDGILRDRSRSDYLQDEQNHGYTRLLEMHRVQIEDGTGLINHEAYNYEKFFDAIQAANADIWDNDMHSTFTGSSMSNYPGQHWFETFYEKYQPDDADRDYTLANTDGQDKDGTAGGDRDTSFKPFRWIREHVFGDRSGYTQYPAVNNGGNTEVVANTSDQARANAQASDAVRQFAVKWYLEDEAAKLMVDNGLGENIAKPDGKIGYDEAVYDLALFEAIAKAYNYLRPFYYYDLDTIYSVEWDSAAGGGADKDYTTLSADERLDNRYYNISSYLPYGVYVIVEQPPQRRDKDINDWKNRSFDIEKPKEVIVPSVYDGPESNDTTDNYDTHYNFDAAMALADQAKSENYLIRFGEENSGNTSGQDDREFVIRAHSYHGDFEVYKYGLDIDRLKASIAAPNGDYTYGGWNTTQETHDPLKDYYGMDHRGEEGVEEIQKENGGNEASCYHGFDAEVTANGNGAETANGSTYDGESLRKRFFYASISEDDGTADQVPFKDGAVDENNASGMSWHNGVKSTTGELTAYDGKYSAALVPWTVTAPADSHTYDAAGFSGYADVNERNRFYTTMLRINKADSETGEYIIHDDAIFGLYAASRYNSFEEIEEDAKLIDDADERAKFLMQFKPGDAKFYLQDTEITGSREFLEAMKAREITPYMRRTALNESMEDPGHLYSGIVPKGTPVCIESERVSLYDGFGERTGQMTVWSTRADVKMDDPETQSRLEYGGQNVGYFKTSQPIGAGVYVLVEIKPPDGYVRSRPVAIEVYSDKTSYYVDGDMYAKVEAVRYESNLLDEYPYK